MPVRPTRTPHERLRLRPPALARRHRSFADRVTEPHDREGRRSGSRDHLRSAPAANRQAGYTSRRVRHLCTASLQPVLPRALSCCRRCGPQLRASCAITGGRQRVVACGSQRGPVGCDDRGSEGKAALCSTATMPQRQVPTLSAIVTIRESCVPSYFTRDSSWIPAAVVIPTMTIASPPKTS